MTRGAIIAISDEPGERRFPAKSSKSDQCQWLREFGVTESAIKCYAGHHREFDIAGRLVLFCSEEHESILPRTDPGCHFVLLTVEELNAYFDTNDEY